MFIYVQVYYNKQTYGKAEMTEILIEYFLTIAEYLLCSVYKKIQAHCVFNLLLAWL